MSRHDDRDEATAPTRPAFAQPEEATELHAHIPDDLRRSASIVLGEEADEEDMTAPTRVRDDELQAAIAASQSVSAPAPASAPPEERTEVNVIRTSDLQAPAQRPRRPNPQEQRFRARAARPATEQPAPVRTAPAAFPVDNPFSEDEPTQAQVFRTSDLDAIVADTAPPAFAPASAPASGAAPSSRFGAPRPYDVHQPGHAPGPPTSHPERPALAERTDPTRPKPRRMDEPVGLAAEQSWSSHVDDTPIARPRSGPPTGFGPAVKGPTRHPGAPIEKGDMSHDTLIRQQLADRDRPLTVDEHDSITNNMLMVGGVSALFICLVLYIADFPIILMLLSFIVVTGGVGALSRQYPGPCESFLNVLSITIRKE